MYYTVSLLENVLNFLYQLYRNSTLLTYVEMTIDSVCVSFKMNREKLHT